MTKPNQPTRRTRLLWLGTAALLLGLGGYLASKPRAKTAASDVAATTSEAPPQQRAASAPPVAPSAAGSPSEPPPPSPKRHGITEIAIRPDHKPKLWVRALLGDGPDQLGIFQGDNEDFPPQGFTVTPDGKLIVLDNAKHRLVWYGESGVLERSMPLEGMVRPTDVGIADDGTLVVGDKLRFMALFDPDGRRKGSLHPGISAFSELDVVGNDVFGYGSMHSQKIGSTSGKSESTTPGLYDQNGRVPGHVAPDGRTVISSGIEDRDERRFFVSVLRDEPPVHVFSRQYSVPPLSSLIGIELTQADRLGTIYVVIAYNEPRTDLVVCLDGQTGDVLGSVPVDLGVSKGTYFRPYAVLRDSGGVVHQRFSDDAAHYEVHDCR